MPRPRLSAGPTISELEQMLATRRAALQKVERDRLKLQKKMDALDAKIRVLGGSSRGGGRVRNAKSLNDAIADVLGRASAPMRVGDIVDKVLASGYRSNSANFRGIVNQALIKDKRFTAAERGTRNELCPAGVVGLKLLVAVTVGLFAVSGDRAGNLERTIFEKLNHLVGFNNVATPGRRHPDCFRLRYGWLVKRLNSSHCCPQCRRESWFVVRERVDLELQKIAKNSANVKLRSKADL